jgi:hypothetical protein
VRKAGFIVLAVQAMVFLMLLFAAAMSITHWLK